LPRENGIGWSAVAPVRGPAPAVFVAQLGAIRRLFRPLVDEGLDHHEARAVRLLLLEFGGLLQLGETSGSRLGIFFEKVRHEEHRDDEPQVRDDRNEEALSPRNGGPDATNVGTIILKVEVHQ
jgi:hypothetical protein